MAFRFKDKERPRGYTSKVAGLLHVGVSLIKNTLKGCHHGYRCLCHQSAALYCQEIIAGVKYFVWYGILVY